MSQERLTSAFIYIMAFFAVGMMLRTAGAESLGKLVMLIAFIFLILYGIATYNHSFKRNKK